MCSVLSVPLRRTKWQQENDYTTWKAVLYFTENITVVGLDEEY
jgi:nuclear transport factor 2 (NTF2) superfamily protein